MCFGHVPLRWLPWLATAAACFGVPDLPGLALSLGFEVAPNGSVLALQEALADGEERSIPCRDLHWGLGGTGRLRCNGSWEVDTSGCLRVGCPWHRLSLRDASYQAPERGLGVSGSAEAPQKWSAAVRGADGALYAAPRYAETVLRVAHDAGGATVTEISPASAFSGSFAKYGSVVLAEDGAVYGIPFSASEVLRIDVESLEVFGDVGSEGFKWLHGVAVEKAIYAVPASASTVLRIDVEGRAVTQLAIAAELPDSLESFLYSVVSPQGEIFGIPADATFVLRIQPSTQVVSALGNFSGLSGKWTHGILGLDGRIYGIPGAAETILRVDPSVPAVETFGTLDATSQKWSSAVLGPDGRIFGVPYGSAQVLLIEPNSDGVSLIGPSWGGGLYKWMGGILALDHNIYMMPYDNERVLRVIPNTTGTDVVEEVLDGFTLPGEHKYTGAAMTPSGAIFAFPAYAAEVMSLLPAEDVCLAGPQLQDASCTLGRPCSLVLSATPGWPVNLSQGLLWVATGTCQEQLEVSGFTNPQGTSGTTYHFGTGLAGNVSREHLLCWSYANSLDIFELGGFQLLGPRQDHQANCSLGLRCEVVVEGVALENSSSLLLAELNGSECNASVAHFEGLTNPVRYAEGGSNLGTAFQGQVGHFRLCWAAEDAEQWVSVGFLVVYGPDLTNQTFLSCWVGFECHLEVSGLGLTAENELSLGEDDCASRNGSLALPGLSNSNPARSENGSSYVFGVASVAYPRVLTMCWHATASGLGITYGTLMIYGPVQPLQIICRFNETCQISLANESIVGSIDDGFSLANRLQLVKDSSCDAVAAPLWDNLTQPLVPLTLNASLLFDLASPVAEDVYAADQVLGSYSLCLSLGDGPFAMKLGDLIVEDVPCAAPGSIPRALAPPCTSSYNGQLVWSLRHGERCLASCEDSSTPSLESLECVYGDLRPSSFECLSSCMLTPVVHNGLSHEACAGLVHGAVCPLQCPVNTVASGYLQCDFGFFVHKALLPREFLFGVPRCYESCDASSLCGAGFELLAHGQRCAVVCPSDSTPDTSEVVCRDGVLDPPGPECLADCAAGPSVDFAVNMAACAMVASGAVCSLQCEAGYAKTGDPVCERGVWTTQRCLAPCVPPVVTNATDGWSSCQGLADGRVVPHGGFCSPSCKQGFLAEVPGGASDLTCADGRLSPETFICRAPCEEAPSVAFADQTVLAACAGTFHNGSCDFRCFSGRVKVGELICQDGIFSNASCLQICDSNPVVPNALPVSGCLGRPNGAICEIQCQPGYSPAYGSVAVCSDGQWSPVRCDKECQAPAVDDAAEPSCQEGTTVESGRNCTPQCAEGLQPTESTLRCTEGLLAPVIFSCSRTCGQVSFIANAASDALVKCEGMQYKKVCTLQCESGFSPTADLMCGRLGWQRYEPTEPLEPSPLPSCERVTCTLPLPSVPGADEAPETATSGTSGACAQAVAGDICSDVRCPSGSILSGHFRCGNDGIWRPVPAGSEVSCAELVCPEMSPVPSGGEASTCVERAIGATCPLQCPSGYRSSSGYVCGADAQWAPLGATPACWPAPCEALPSLSNALDPQECVGLASGSTCPGQCTPPWQALGQYRCASGRWVEVPLCLPPEMGNGTSVPAVSFSTLLEPSSDLRAFYSLEDWAELGEAALELAVRRQVETVQALAPATVRVLGRGLAARRLQELKPGAWQVDVHLLVAPQPVAGAAQQASAVLQQLQPGLGEAVVQALPSVARPRQLRLSATQPVEVALPAQAAAALAGDGLVFTTSSTTGTGAVYVVPGQPASQESNQTQIEEIAVEPESLDARLVLLLVSIPVACGLSLYVSRRLQRFFSSSHTTATEADKVDFQFVLKEERMSEDTAGDVSLNQVRLHERMQSMRSQRDDLHETMTKGIMAAATLELEAEARGENEDEERPYDLAKLGEQKQMPTIGKGLERLENPGGGGPRSDHIVDVRSLRLTGQMTARSNTNLTKRDRRDILKSALCACWKEGWYTFVESIPLPRCCRCRCCRRPKEQRPDEGETAAEEEISSSESERTVEVFHRPRRASRISLSSCDAAEAMADGIARGLSPEQVNAIRDFWNFRGADELIEDLEDKIPYHVALRGEKADPSLASRYHHSEEGGNVVSEKIAEVRLHGEEERSEVHTLTLHPPSRRAVKARETAELPEEVEEEEEEMEEEVEESSHSTHDFSEVSESSESIKEETVNVAASAMETNLSTAHQVDVTEIPELDAGELRAAVERAMASQRYARSYEPSKEAKSKTDAHGDEDIPEKLNQFTIATIL